MKISSTQSQNPPIPLVQFRWNIHLVLRYLNTLAVYYTCQILSTPTTSVTNVLIIKLHNHLSVNLLGLLLQWNEPRHRRPMIHLTLLATSTPTTSVLSRLTTLQAISPQTVSILGPLTSPFGPMGNMSQTETYRKVICSPLILSSRTSEHMTFLNQVPSLPYHLNPTCTNFLYPN